MPLNCRCQNSSKNLPLQDVDLRGIFKEKYVGQDGQIRDIALQATVKDKSEGYRDFENPFEM